MCLALQKTLKCFVQKRACQCLLSATQLQYCMLKDSLQCRAARCSSSLSFQGKACTAADRKHNGTLWSYASVCVSAWGTLICRPCNKIAVFSSSALLLLVTSKHLQCQTSVVQAYATVLLCPETKIFIPMKFLLLLVISKRGTRRTYRASNPIFRISVARAIQWCHNCILFLGKKILLNSCSQL